MTTESPAMTLRDLQAALSRPFPAGTIAVKPGALTKDRTRGLALAYADPRAYMARLDEVVGPESWTVSYTVVSAGILCRLTVLGLAKADVGDLPLDPGDPNRLTSAAMQAFKRACALFGLGRYLYDLPQIWADYDEAKRAFRDPRAVIHQLYTLAGLTSDGTLRADHDAAAVIATEAPGAHTEPHVAATAGRARTALAAAERRAHDRPPSTRAATERQLALLRDRDQGATAQERFGVARLEDLSFSQASSLIGDLPPHTGRRHAEGANHA